MKSKGFKKLFLLYGVIILIFTLTSCSCYGIPEPHSFQEGEYRYVGEEIHFYKDIYLEGMSLFVELVEDDGNLPDRTNLIVDRKTKNTYKLALILKVKGKEESVQCDIESLPRIGNHVAAYVVNLNISKLTPNEETYFKGDFVLEAPYDYEKGTYYQLADEIQILISVFTVDGVTYDKSSDSFPNCFRDYYLRLNYVKEKN